MYLKDKPKCKILVITILILYYFSIFYYLSVDTDNANEYKGSVQPSISKLDNDHSSVKMDHFRRDTINDDTINV